MLLSLLTKSLMVTSTYTSITKALINLTIKNWYALSLIGKTLDWLGRAK